MSVRYFFIKDWVDAGDFKIEHCPTKEMRGGYFTKPLQGNLFTYLRGLIMGFEMKDKNGVQITWDNLDECII